MSFPSLANHIQVLSMSWLILVIPSTFAEAIGLGLKKSGSWGYLDVQIFVAIMYIAAFVASWSLRAWKVWEMDQAHLDEKEVDMAIRDESVVLAIADETRTEHNSTAQRRLNPYRGLWAIVRV
jgi:hypothetical protein